MWKWSFKRVLRFSSDSEHHHSGFVEINLQERFWLLVQHACSAAASQQLLRALHVACTTFALQG